MYFNQPNRSSFIVDKKLVYKKILYYFISLFSVLAFITLQVMSRCPLHVNRCCCTGLTRCCRTRLSRVCTIWPASTCQRSMRCSWRRSCATCTPSQTNSECHCGQTSPPTPTSQPSVRVSRDSRMTCVTTAASTALTNNRTSSHFRTIPGK